MMYFVFVVRSFTFPEMSFAFLVKCVVFLMVSFVFLVMSVVFLMVSFVLLVMSLLPRLKPERGSQPPSDVSAPSARISFFFLQAVPEILKKIRTGFLLL